MHEAASIRRQAAVDRVRECLRELHGVDPAPLGRRAIAAYHHRFRIKSGWRLPVDFGEPDPRHIDVLIPEGFPLARPQFGLVERPPFLTWPHVERDGSLCLLANMSEFDSDDPAGVVVRLLGKSCTLVRDLLAGAWWRGTSSTSS